MEIGKTGRYFKYAIGEIILVVIGILIALQINNWNEVRLDKRKAVDYHQRLLEDLDRVTQRSSNVLSNSNETLASIVDAISFLEKGELTSTMEKERFNYALLWYSRFNYQMPDLSTLEEMKSSGHLGLIYNKDVRKNIINFGSYLDNVESIIQTLGQTIQNNQFIDKHVRFNTNPNTLEIGHSYNFNTLSNDPEFINSFSRMTGHWRGSAFFMGQIIKRAEILRIEISEELKRIKK